MPIQDPNKPPQDGSYREQPKALAPKAFNQNEARDSDGQWTDGGGGGGSSLASIVDKHRKAGVTLDISESRNTGALTLSMIKVPEDKRGQGLANKAMRDVIAYADRQNKIIGLTPEVHGTGGLSKAALTRWYKGFGFVPNKGRNADYSISEAMIRYPSGGKALAKNFEPLPHLHPGRKGDLDRQHRNIDLAKGTVERHFNRLERSLKEKSQADWARWDRKFAADIHAVVEKIVETEGTIYAFKLGGTFDMGLVANYLRAMAESAAESINLKIRMMVDDVGVSEALGQRATTVASAGTGLGANATRWAREEAARQSPDAEHRVKTWIADTNRHAEFDGDTVPVGADWPSGFAPGTVPGCACTQSIQ
jgi:predicted GNAT family acetyltransferase